MDTDPIQCGADACHLQTREGHWRQLAARASNPHRSAVAPGVHRRAVSRGIHHPRHPGGDGDHDVSVAYLAAQPPNWSPTAEFDEYLKVAFAKLAQQDTLSRAEMKDIFVKLAIEKHLAPLWFSFFSLATESSRPCQKMADMVGNFGATMPQGPGMDKLQALCRTIPPSNDDDE